MKLKNGLKQFNLLKSFFYIVYMSSYINNISIHGMMNKLAFTDAELPCLGFYKKKDRSKVVLFEWVDDVSKYQQVNFMYLDSNNGNKNAHSMKQITSIVDDLMFSTMPGKKYRELRETRNKYQNVIRVEELSKDNMGVVLNMIEEWRYLDNGGWKYGFNEHAAIDKEVVRKYVDGDLNKYTIGTAFFIGDRCIGYSVIANKSFDSIDSIPEYKYLTRKVLLLKDYRNLTEYIDWYTFKQLYDIYHDDKFLINWGCSSGGVYKYKTTKWPVYSLDDKWFLTIKNK